MGKKVSARIKNRIKMHFVRSIRMLEKKFGGMKEHKFAPKSGRFNKKSE
jgi:hypothetical protein